MIKDGALSGIKIISFAQLAQGPSAVQYLADLGAEVIKVERPGKGAWERSWSGMNAYVNGESVFFLGLNRNRKSLTVNVKDDKGKEIIYRLIKDSDILIENFRPGVMDRLGFGYDKLSEINPGLVYASASGYGSSGPYRDLPGQDLLAQSLGGLASVTGKGGDLPTLTGASIVDIHSSSLMVIGILSALLNRDRTGQGQKVEVSLLEAAIDLQKEAITYYLNGSGEKSLQRSKSGIGAPFYEAPCGIYATEDGYLAISLTPLAKLGKALGSRELIDDYSQDDAFDKRDEIRELIKEIILTKTTEEWLDIFKEYDIWGAPVKNYAQLAEDPQVKHNETIKEISRDDLGNFKVINCPIKMSRTEPRIYSAPPKLGEHSNEVLKSLGYKDEEIKKLQENGVI